jgi:acyl-[acyl-carrier-protein]-phospholipid O-acyltransferase / long-chain-fatty-acid--[acyl-carrier-protein] ligase
MNMIEQHGTKWQRGFWSLFVTQFQETFSDNAYKFFLISFVTAMGLTTSQRDSFVFEVGALFAIPFILFSMTGGYLADRFSKRSVIIGLKIAEILVMGLALAGLFLHNFPVMVVALFLRSTQSACFSPSKFGLLPELLPEQQLSWGNGVFELGIFLAIILGTVGGSTMHSLFVGRLWWAGVILVGLSFVGLASGSQIDRIPAADPNRKFRANFVSEFVAQIRLIRQDRTLYLAVLGNTFFYFVAALLQFNIVIYAADVLKVSETRGSYLQAAVAIGIGLGSFATGYLSGHKIEYGFIPLGALGITVFAVLLSVPGLLFFEVALGLTFLGLAAGFFAVPVNALIQHRPAAAMKGAVIGASNLQSWIGILLASAVYYGLSDFAKLRPGSIFLICGLMTLAATVYLLVLLPDALLRLVLWVLVHTVYRMRVDGRENVPAKGGALLVCNHLSFVDALVLVASVDRPVRFLIYKDFYDHPVIHPFAAMGGAIPISSELRPREMIRSLRAAGAAIAAGEVVCIFAEGQMTRIGQLLPFRRGLEFIVKGSDAPIIPVQLGGVWGSIFSYEDGKYFWKLPKRLLQPVTVSFGRPMPSTSTAFEVRQAVEELQTEAYRHQKSYMQTLPQAFVRSARTNRFRFAMADGQKQLRFGAALTRTIFLARRLKTLWPDGQNREDMVGILLPPSIAGALVNFAILLLGKVPVHLNYTLTSEGIASCISQCGIRTVISSKAFRERVRVEVPGKIVLLEELSENPGAVERITALAMSWLLPGALLGKALRDGIPKSNLDDVATVIFSSGSTGEPKGVMLTHYNIGSNVAQLAQCFAFTKQDRILGVLPFFHSFGFTGTMALPLISGVGVVYHPNPLDSRSIGALVSQYGVTFLLSTPTFLQAYTRRCSPEQFGSIRLVMVGAEKMQERTAQAFQDKFGIRPLEAYGCTECSPAVTVNTNDFRAAGFRQTGSKRGKIGHALPGVSVRIVDPETFQTLPVGSPGLLLVRGPNVMKGYLGRPVETAKVIHDGWYVTGDIATLDLDGFLEITDRLSRFSKIGGEMVPHIKVEEKLQDLAESGDQVFAVTSGPDEKKGERLLVLHTLSTDQIASCMTRLTETGLPNLWVPRQDAFFKVDSLPCLGTGKLDLRKIRELAQGLALQRSAL